jgi:hypothetical protein
MDIKRARELLGKKGEKMTDDEIMELQGELEIVAGIVIDQVVKSKKPRVGKALG